MAIQKAAVTVQVLNGYSPLIGGITWQSTAQPYPPNPQLANNAIQFGILPAVPPGVPIQWNGYSTTGGTVTNAGLYTPGTTPGTDTIQVVAMVNSPPVLYATITIVTS